MILGANDQTNNSTLEKYCYNNDTANCAIYGGLYQWAEAVQYQNGASNTTSPSPAFSGNVKGICPTGWHVPSDGEFQTLETFLGGVSVAGASMKSTTLLWSSPNTGANNSSNFSALPAGLREINTGNFDRININAYYWSSYANGISNIPFRDLGNNNSFSTRYTANSIDRNIELGFSIRCLKD
jgi:uncharacterized protein (TIGR02145 family)